MYFHHTFYFLTLDQLFDFHKFFNFYNLIRKKLLMYLINLVSYSLESSVKAMISYNKRKWKLIWGISCFIVVLECFYLLVSTFPVEHIRGITCVSGVMMIFAFWSCFFAKELPSFYDENRINYVSQGIFRIHMPGLTFNNSNWTEILKLLRIFFYICGSGYTYVLLYFYVNWRLSTI